MDVAEPQLFLYVAITALAMCVFIALAKHGNTILIDEVLRREEEGAETSVERG